MILSIKVYTIRGKPIREFISHENQTITYDSKCKVLLIEDYPNESNTLRLENIISYSVALVEDTKNA